MNVRRVRLSVAIAILLAAGCGDDGDRAATVVTTTQPADTAMSAPTLEATTDDDVSSTTVSTASSSSSTTTVMQRGSLSGFDPESVIITLQDLPAGWAEGGLEDDESTDADGEMDCGDEVFVAAGLDPDAENPDELSEEAQFSQAALGPFLFASVGATEDARQRFELLPEALASCDGTVDSDGNTIRVLPVSFPNIGDETFAARMDFEGGFFAASMLLAMVRQGDAVLLAGHLTIGAPTDAVLLEDVLRTMVSRL